MPGSYLTLFEPSSEEGACTLRGCERAFMNVHVVQTGSPMNRKMEQQVIPCRTSRY